MRRLLLLAALCATAAACKFDAPGRCGSRADCTGGLVCAEGVCALCGGDSDCEGWEACGTAKLCALRAGRCNRDLDCASWDQCDGTHTCVLRPGHCPENKTCQEWEHCDGNRHCSLNVGRCYGDTNCAAWAQCDAVGHACEVETAGGADILLWGTLSPGAGCYALAPVSNPTRMEVGFGNDRNGILSPTGSFVYRMDWGTGSETLRTFVGDSLSYNTEGYWTYPATPWLNDPVAIATSVCPDDWYWWAMQAGTGALMYACNVSSNVGDYYDAASDPVPGLTSVRVVSWNANDYKLVQEPGQGVTTPGLPYAVVAPNGTRTSIAALSASHSVVAARATATGFRLATSDVLNPKKRWLVGQDGVATLEGSYSTTLTGHTISGSVAMDTDGNLYAIGWNSDLPYDEIFRMPLAPDPVTVVYTEADAPTTYTRGVHFVYIHGSSLVSSP